MRVSRITPRATYAALSMAMLAVGACTFEPLVPAPDSGPERSARLDGSVIIGGLEVAPSVIHPGDEVLIVDPWLAPPGTAAPIYFWDACAGSITQPAGAGREAVWTAPDAPGIYSVTVNATGSVRGTTSTVIELCVVEPGRSSCTANDGEPPDLIAIAPSRSELFERDCGSEGCATDVTCEASHTADAELRYRWTVRRGTVAGEGRTVTWSLPAVGCCPEELAIAVTVCDAEARAATGYAYVRISPE